MTGAWKGDPVHNNEKNKNCGLFFDAVQKIVEEHDLLSSNLPI